MAVLLIAGYHVPVIPLVDLVGNGDNATPTQIAATGENVGATIGFTIIFILTGLAQRPSVGVKS